jgi:hypothetical protein
VPALHPLQTGPCIGADVTTLRIGTWNELPDEHEFADEGGLLPINNLAIADQKFHSTLKDETCRAVQREALNKTFFLLNAATFIPGIQRLLLLFTITLIYFLKGPFLVAVATCTLCSVTIAPLGYPHQKEVAATAGPPASILVVDVLVLANLELESSRKEDVHGGHPIKDLLGRTSVGCSLPGIIEISQLLHTYAHNGIANHFVCMCMCEREICLCMYI